MGKKVHIPLTQLMICLNFALMPHLSEERIQSGTCSPEWEHTNETVLYFQTIWNEIFKKNEDTGFIHLQGHLRGHVDNIPTSREGKAREPQDLRHVLWKKLLSEATVSFNFSNTTKWWAPSDMFFGPKIRVELCWKATFTFSNIFSTL